MIIFLEMYLHFSIELININWSLKFRGKWIIVLETYN